MRVGGEVWNTYRKHYGPQGDPLILVAQGASTVFNPTLPQSLIDRALERDHAAASAEYMAEFRTDLEAFVNYDTVTACVDAGVRERPPVSGTKYYSFTDPSGGSCDSMTCAIGHRDGDLIVVDALREITAPFDPESAVDEFANLMKSYRVRETTGDRYAGAWCSQSFERRGIHYRPSDLNKSGLYLDLLPKLNSKTVRMLDHPRCISQICSLERRTARGGRDSVDHAPNGRDDLANAIAGLCSIATARRGDVMIGFIEDGCCGRVIWRDDPQERTRIRQVKTPEPVVKWR